MANLKSIQRKLQKAILSTGLIIKIGHPYRSHGKYRYVVYCVRDRGQKITKEKNGKIATMKYYAQHLNMMQ